jgi:hypothetical protein
MDRNPPRHGPAHGTPSRRSESAAPEGSALTWVRRHLIPVALLAVLAVGLAVAGLVFVGGGGKPPSSASHTMGNAAAQAASTVTKGSKWLGGSQAKQLAVVNADVGAVMAAERAGSHSAAAKAAGARLAADAAAALSGSMPPVDAVAYRAALRRLGAAGSSAASGKYGPKAAHLLNAGEAGLMKVTAAADTPVPVKTPAIPEPNGQ